MELLRAAREAVAGHGPGRLERLTVAVGELSGVEPDLLRYAWEAVTVDEPERGSALTVDWHPARQTCPACGVVEDRVEGGWLRGCPGCGGLLRVDGGDELTLVELDYTLAEGEEGASS